MLSITKINRSNVFWLSLFANTDPKGIPAIKGNKARKDKVAILGVSIPYAINIGICVIPTQLKKREIVGVKVSRLRLRLLRNVTDIGADNPAAVCMAPPKNPTGMAIFCAVLI